MLKRLFFVLLVAGGLISGSAHAQGQQKKPNILIIWGEVAKYIATFKEFPPSQKVGSFSLDHVLEQLQAGQTAGK